MSKIIYIPPASSAGSFVPYVGAVSDVDLGTKKITFAGGTLTGLLKGAKGANIASAATTDLSTATGNEVHITGSIAITSFGIVTAGTAYYLIFDAAPLITYNAVSMILPTGASIQAAAGDSAIFVSEGAGNFKCIAYQKAGAAGLYTFSNGITETPVGTVKNDLITGKVGGQTVVGGINANDVLIIKSTLGNTLAFETKAITFKVGNNGATEAASLTDLGNLSVPVTKKILLDGINSGSAYITSPGTSAGTFFAKDTVKVSCNDPGFGQGDLVVDYRGNYIYNSLNNFFNVGSAGFGVSILSMIAGASSKKLSVGGTAKEWFVSVGSVALATTALASYSAAANMFNANGNRIDFRFTFQVIADATATKQIQITFAGGHVIYDSTAQVYAVGDFIDITGYILRENATTARSYTSANNNTIALGSYVNYDNYAALNWGVANLLEAYATTAGAGSANNDIVLVGGFVKFSEKSQ